MKTESLDMGSIEMQPGFGMEKCSHQCQPSKLTSRKVQAVDFHQCSTYCKDTEPFISCFHVLTYNTSFQYLSIHAMSVIACYNYMLSNQLLTIYQGVHITYFILVNSSFIVANVDEDNVAAC